MSNLCRIKIPDAKIVLTFWVLATIFGDSFAQSQSQDTLQVPAETIYVKEETKLSSGLIEAPIKIETLSKDYIEEQQYQDLSEAVNDIPGVITVGTDRDAGSKTAVIQGLGENSVLIMIDGVPVSQNSSFGFDLSQIATSEIERVEVIKGGSSSLYGSQAMGGVINIITKDISVESKLEVEASGSLLSEGLSVSENDKAAKRNYKGRLEKKWRNGLRLRTSFMRRESDLFDLDPSSMTNDGPETRSDQISARIVAPLKEVGLPSYQIFVDFLQLDGKLNSQTSRPFSSNGFGLVENKSEDKTLNSKIGLEGNAFGGKLRIIYNHEKNDNQLILNDNPNTSYIETTKFSESKGDRFDLQLREVNIKNHSFTIGGLYKRNEVTQSTLTQAITGPAENQELLATRTIDVANHPIQSLEFYLQDNFWIGDFEISPGIRHQNDRDFGSYSAPKINLAYYNDIGRVGVKSWFSVGTGYRTPAPKERFFTLDHTSVANYIVTGNQNLRPEESLSFQLGTEFKFQNPVAKSDKASLYANLFLNQIKNLIDITQIEGNSSLTTFTYTNFNQAISRGFELGLTASYSSLDFKLNGSYTETFDESTSLYLAGRPLYSGLLNITYHLTSSTNIILQNRYTGSTFANQENTILIPETYQSHVKFNTQITDKIKGFLSINNIFDQKRPPSMDTVVPTYDGRPVRGRELFAGINARVF